MRLAGDSLHVCPIDHPFTAGPHRGQPYVFCLTGSCPYGVFRHPLPAVSLRGHAVGGEGADATARSQTVGTVVDGAFNENSARLTGDGDVQYHVRVGGLDVRTMSYTESRAKYAETLNAVVDDREEIVITRAGHDPVVMVALDDYESLKETAYLLRNPANARRLLNSIERLERGQGVAHNLVE